jgi:hypothetical protein
LHVGPRFFSVFYPFCTSNWKRARKRATVNNLNVCYCWWKICFGSVQSAEQLDQWRRSPRVQGNNDGRSTFKATDDWVPSMRPQMHFWHAAVQFRSMFVPSILHSRLYQPFF